MQNPFVKSFSSLAFQDLEVFWFQPSLSSLFLVSVSGDKLFKFVFMLFQFIPTQSGTILMFIVKGSRELITGLKLE